MLSQNEYEKLTHAVSFSDITPVDIQRCIIAEILPQMKKKYDYSLICANVEGSIARGMSNTVSDIDVRLFGDFGVQKLEVSYAFPTQIKGYAINVDCAIHEFEEVLSWITQYNNREKKYPTIFYRTQTEREAFAQRNLYWHGGLRPDANLAAGLDYLVANNIVFDWKQEKRIRRLEESYRVIDALDLQYARAQGNYLNFVKDMERVNPRKYINIVYQILMCRWILNFESVPSANIKDLIERVGFDTAIEKSLAMVFEVHSKSKRLKQNTFMDRDSTMDDFIVYSLKELKTEISKFNAQLYWSDLKHDEWFIRDFMVYGG